MCLGQIGKQLLHGVVPAVMVSHLIPAWGLGNAQAGLTATGVLCGPLALRWSTPGLGAAVSR